MDNQLYRKVGRKYKPIGYSDGFTGFPAEGIWLVEKGDGKNSSSCILQIGDVPKLYPFANLVMYKDEMSSLIRKYFDTKDKNLIAHGKTTYGAWELSEFIIKGLNDKILKDESKNKLLTSD